VQQARDLFHTIGDIAREAGDLLEIAMMYLLLA
jgi:hypothetical protein